MSKIRIGIVGVGAIAVAAHLPNYAKHADVEVIAFADPEVKRVNGIAETFAKTTGRSKPNVYSNLQDMLQNERLDAVSICTPNTSHVALSLEALNAGLHVLVEKPMSTSLEDADVLLDKVYSSGKTLMVGMSHRYRQDVSVLKKYVENGDLGDIYFAKTRILRRRGTPKGWFTDKQISGGGPLLDIGVHALDLTWWLMGTPKAQSVNGYLVKGIGNDGMDFLETWTAMSDGNQNNEVYTTEDFAAGFIRFENGSVLEIEVSWAINGPEDDAVKVDLFGRKGGISLDPIRFYGSANGVLTSVTPTVGMGPLHEREINHFITCVQTGTKPCSDVAQGRDIVQMLNGITKSSELGMEVIL